MAAAALAAVATVAPPPPSTTAIWDALYKTDPAHTKGFSRSGGFKGTAIKPMYAVKKMTERFGAVGTGWGWDHLETRVESGMVFCLASVWYIGEHGGRMLVGAQWGGTEIMASKGAGNGTRADDECFKKSLTDAILKGLSYLGVGADIHMGQFDDTKYVEEVKAEVADAKGAAADKKQRSADEAWASGVIALIGVAKDADALMNISKANGKKFKEVNPRSPDLCEMVAQAGVARREALAAPPPLALAAPVLPLTAAEQDAERGETPEDGPPPLDEA